MFFKSKISIFELLVKLFYNKKINFVNEKTFDTIIPKSMVGILFIVSICLLFIFTTDNLVFDIFFWFLFFVMVVKSFVLFSIYSHFYLIKKQKTDTNETNIEKYYKLLGLEINCSEIELKKRYRELSKKWHPDKYINDTIENQQISNRNFKKLNDAYKKIINSKN